MPVLLALAVAILARIGRGCRCASVIARCLPSSWLDSLARVCGRHSCSRWRGLLLYMCHSVLAVQRLLMLLPEHWEDARPPSACLSCSHWWPPFSHASAGAVAVPASSHTGRAGGHNSCSRPISLLLEGGIVVAVSLRAGRAETADARAVGCMASQYGWVSSITRIGGRHSCSCRLPSFRRYCLLAVWRPLIPLQECVLGHDIGGKHVPAKMARLPKRQSLE